MIKASAILLIGLLAAALLRRQSAALRHWVLASAIACAAAMPVVQLIAPAWQIPMTAFLTSHQNDVSLAAGATLTEWLADGPAIGTQPGVASGQRILALSSLVQIWLMGVVTSLSLLLVGLGRLAWVTSRSRQVVDGTWSDVVIALSRRRKPRTPVRLLQTDHPTLLVTWGLMHPKVILPRAAREWPADRIRAVLGHELAHVERRDWAVQMVAEFLRCIYWFNPLIWVACHRLRQESEKACDDAVLSMGINAPEYATHLLDVARAFRHTQTRRSVFPAPAMARPSHLERRVRVMLNTGLNHAPLTRLAGISVAVGLLGMTIPIAGLVAASEVPQPSLSQTSIAETTRSVAGDQLLPAPPVAAVTERGKNVGVRPQAQGGDRSSAPISTASRTTEQISPAAYSGTLMDATGHAMSGVLALVSSAMAQRVEMRTDEGGQFSITGLPAGEYQVEVKKPGFLTKQGRIVLAAGQQLRQDVVAQIGSLAETIFIQGGPSTPDSKPAVPRQLRRPGTSDADPCSQSVAGGCLTPPTKLVDMKPVFPQAHGGDSVSGTVVVEARLGTDGFLKDLRVNDGADPAFAASTLEAVRQWQFSPVRLNGIPQECRVVVTAEFHAGSQLGAGPSIR
jgi:TonB family protein